MAAGQQAKMPNTLITPTSYQRTMDAFPMHGALKSTATHAPTPPPSPRVHRGGESAGGAAEAPKARRCTARLTVAKIERRASKGRRASFATWLKTLFMATPMRNALHYG